MTHRHCFEALDKSLKDVMLVLDVGNAEVPFGGKFVVFGGDFRQTLPVVSKGSRADVVVASLCSSYLWSFCKVLRLTKNMRLQVGSSTDNVEELRKFSEWLLEIGDGIAGVENDGEVDLELPADLLIQDVTNPIKTLVDVTYPDLLGQLWNPEYLQQRTILAPTHEIVESVNEYVLSLIKKDERIYLSCDEVCSDDRGTGDGDIHSIEFLNSIKCVGLPNHQLKLKVGVMVMLLRNIDQSRGLCNGTRLIVTDLGARVIRCTVLTGSHKGAFVGGGGSNGGCCCTMVEGQPDGGGEQIRKQKRGGGGVVGGCRNGGKEVPRGSSGGCDGGDFGGVVSEFGVVVV
ncbi:uncharacterized protein LOC141630335 [Silene latifolia]|uniref:uncharacterized protein LOC141630335 n=1 Tax=Silene latifolia TaxID=37657 RepID=UPI003D7878E9